MWNSKLVYFVFLQKQLVVFKAALFLISVMLFPQGCSPNCQDVPRTDWWALKLYVWLLGSVGCNHRRDRACELFIGTVGSGLEKCLFEYLLYLQSLKEMHSTMDGSIFDSNTCAHYGHLFGNTVKRKTLSSCKGRCDKPSVDWSMSKLDKNNSTVILNHKHESVFVKGMALRNDTFPETLVILWRQPKITQQLSAEWLIRQLKLVCCTLHFLPPVYH